jgi:hypothetical protein
MKTETLSSRIGLALVMVAGLSMSATVHATTYTFKSSGEGLYAYTSQFDPATGSSTYAYASVGTNKFHVPPGGPSDSSYGELYYSSYNGMTGDSCYGYAYQVTDQLSVTGNLSSGMARGPVTLNCYTNGTYTTEDIVLAIDVQATSGISKTKYSNTFKDPSHFNSSYSFTGSYRTGTVTFKVDGAAIPAGDPFYSYSYGQLSSGTSTTKETFHP